MFDKIHLRVGFWSLYAFAYDTLLQLEPYNAMLDSVVAGLSPAPNEVVLDVGCGSGNVTRRLLDQGYRVEAFDSSPGMLQRAHQKCPEANCHRVDLSMGLHFGSHTFAGITCSNVLYNLSDPKASLQEFFRVLKPGGQLVLTNPKAGFSMGEVLKQHWKSQPWSKRLRLVLNLPKLALLTMFNLALLNRQGKKLLYFPQPDELLDLVASVGFCSCSVEQTYAGQGWLVRAQKPEGNAGR